MKNKGKKSKAGSVLKSGTHSGQLSSHSSDATNDGKDFTKKRRIKNDTSPEKPKQAKERGRVAMAFSKSTVASRNKLVKRSSSTASEKQVKALKPSPKKWLSVGGKFPRPGKNQPRATTPASDHITAEGENVTTAPPTVTAGRSRSFVKSCELPQPRNEHGERRPKSQIHLVPCANRNDDKPESFWGEHNNHLDGKNGAYPDHPIGNLRPLPVDSDSVIFSREEDCSSSVEDQPSHPKARALSLGRVRRSTRRHQKHQRMVSSSEPSPSKKELSVVVSEMRRKAKRSQGPVLGQKQKEDKKQEGEDKRQVMFQDNVVSNRSVLALLRSCPPQLVSTPSLCNGNTTQGAPVGIGTTASKTGSEYTSTSAENHPVRCEKPAVHQNNGVSCVCDPCSLRYCRDDKGLYRSQKFYRHQIDGLPSSCNGKAGHVGCAKDVFPAKYVEQSVNKTDSELRSHHKMPKSPDGDGSKLCKSQTTKKMAYDVNSPLGFPHYENRRASSSMQAGREKLTSPCSADANSNKGVARTNAANKKAVHDQTTELRCGCCGGEEEGAPSDPSDEVDKDISICDQGEHTSPDKVQTSAEDADRAFHRHHTCNRSPSTLSGAINERLRSLAEFQALLSRNMRDLLSELDQIVESITDTETQSSNVCASQTGKICFRDVLTATRPSNVHDIIEDFEKTNCVFQNETVCNKAQQTERCYYISTTTDTRSDSEDFGSKSAAGWHHPRANEDSGGPMPVNERDRSTCTELDIYRPSPACAAWPWLRLHDRHSISVQTDPTWGEGRMWRDLCCSITQNGSSSSNGFYSSNPDGWGKNVSGPTANNNATAAAVRLISLLTEMEMWKKRLSLTEEGDTIFQSDILSHHKPRETPALLDSGTVPICGEATFTRPLSQGASRDRNFSSCVGERRVLLSGKRRRRRLTGFAGPTCSAEFAWLEDVTSKLGEGESASISDEKNQGDCWLVPPTTKQNQQRSTSPSADVRRGLVEPDEVSDMGRHEDPGNPKPSSDQRRGDSEPFKAADGFRVVERGRQPEESDNSWRLFCMQCALLFFTMILQCCLHFAWTYFRGS